MDPQPFVPAVFEGGPLDGGEVSKLFGYPETLELAGHPEAHYVRESYRRYTWKLRSQD